jgi:hypothetical protein
MTMSDLRNRIAKVLLGDQPYTSSENAAAHVMADAVIRELKLQPYDTLFGVAQRRYITGWVDDVMPTERKEVLS